MSRLPEFVKGNGVYIFIFLFAFYLIGVGYVNFYSGYFWSSGGDATMLNQVHYNFLLGKPFYTSGMGFVSDAVVVGGNFLAGHAYLSSLIFLPLLYIFNSPYALLGLQIFFVVFIGAVYLYKLIDARYSDKKYAALSVILYLFFSPMLIVVQEKYYPYNLCIPGFIILLYALYKNKNVLYLLSFLFIIGTEEDLAATTFLIGIYVFYYHKKKILGIITAGFSLFYFLIVISFIQPFYSPDVIKYSSQKIYFLSNVMHHITNINQVTINKFLMPLLLVFLMCPFIFYIFKWKKILKDKPILELFFLLLISIPQFLTGFTQFNHSASSFSLIFISNLFIIKSYNIQEKTFRFFKRDFNIFKLYVFGFLVIAFIMIIRSSYMFVPKNIFEIGSVRTLAEKITGRPQIPFNPKINDLKFISELIPRDKSISYLIEYSLDPYLVFGRTDCTVYPYKSTDVDYLVIDKGLMNNTLKIENLRGEIIKTINYQQEYEIILKSNQYNIIFENQIYTALKKNGNK